MIAVSSFLLLSIACYSSKADPTDFKKESLEELSSESEDSFWVREDVHIPLEHLPEPTPDFAMVSINDSCRKGEMPFEGGCRDKDQVQEILDTLDHNALVRVQEASTPNQVADAGQDLLEQQIIQMGKTEDDLDEIIEQLKREKMVDKELHPL